MTEAITDQQIIQLKLLAKDTMMYKVTDFYFKFYNLVINEESSIEQCKEAYLNLHKELLKVKLGIDKLHIMYNMLERQEIEFQQESKDIENNIKGKLDSIEKLKEVLKEEKINRNNQESYDSLTQRLKTYPNRLITQQSIEKLEMNLEELNEQEGTMSEIIDLRSKQFQLLLFAVEDLSKHIEGDTTTSSSSSSFPKVGSKRKLTTTNSKSNNGDSKRQKNQ
eukprot:TRINITY_DN2403_c0_g1_i4.p1 TRINITY_DN2403_c0_g1~~TRINITY_DN2403_c0_g1_i4.p1  ORF type:complete len:222 (+),score=55.95 TRINITY_DN2403_c0_g1_i4:53-718(+)